MPPRRDVSEERESQILNAAEQVFTEKGFASARMEDIAENTGLSKGTLYLYFKSKDGLIAAVLDRLFKAIMDQFTPSKSEDLTASEAIWQFTESAIRDYQRMQRVVPIAYEFLAMAARRKVVQTAFRRYFNAYMNALVPVIQRGIDRGELRPVDANEVAIAAGAIFEGTLLLWVYDNDRVDIGRHIRSGIKLLLEGILVSE